MSKIHDRVGEILGSSIDEKNLALVFKEQEKKGNMTQKHINELLLAIITYLHEQEQAS